MAKQQIPATVLEALKSGYRIIRQTSKQVAKGRCAGTVHLENGSRPGLVASYEADRTGYRFAKPEAKAN